MEFEHRSGIYKCTCIANEKSYIGQSKDVKLRKNNHLYLLRNNKHTNEHFQNSYNKYGENSFTWDVLEYCDEGLLNSKEIYWIDFFNTYKDGFNLTKGGSPDLSDENIKESLRKRSKSLKDSWRDDDDRRKLFSERMLGENNPMYGRTGSLNPAYGKDHSGEKNGMYGRHHSEESNEKNRKAHLGAKNKNSRPVFCIELQVVFASQGEAGRETHCADSTINKCCRGVKKTAGGYHWRYATQEEIDNKMYIA